MARLLAALLLLAPQDAPTSAPASSDRTVAVELSAANPVLAGHGPSQRVEHTVDFAGKLQVWTQVEGDLDTCLRIEDTAGKRLAEDDDSGGKPTPHAMIEVEPGQQIVIVVAASNPSGHGRVELHLVAAPETSSTLKAAAAALASVSKSKSLAAKQEFESARAEIAAAVRTLLATSGVHTSVSGIQALSALGGEAFTLGDLASSQTARTAVVTDVEHILPPDHAVLQSTRWYLAWTLRRRGSLAEARALDEQVVAVRVRTLGEDHPDLRDARATLATDWMLVGELQPARELQERVLAACLRDLPADSAPVQWARSDLADTLVRLGDLEGARDLQESVLAVRQRTLPDDHLDLAWARAGLAWTIGRLGDLKRAKALQELVLQARSGVLPEEHPDLLAARANLAVTLSLLGDVRHARDHQERVLEVLSRSMPPGHPDLDAARNNLALTVRSLGDLPRARRLLELVVADRARSRSREGPDDLRGLSNLAETIALMGDTLAARALIERVLAQQEQILPEGNPDLCSSIRSLAGLEMEMHQPDRAIVLLERLIGQQMRRLGPDDPDVLLSRGALAGALYDSGEFEKCRAAYEEILAARLRSPDSPYVAAARLYLAASLLALGRIEESTPRLEEVLAEQGRSLPRESTLLLKARNWLIAAELGTGRRERAETLGLEQCQFLVSRCELATLGLSPREAEATMQGLRGKISTVVDLAVSSGGSKQSEALARDAFTLVETARCVGLASRAALRAAEISGEVGERATRLRGEIQQVTTELAVLATSASSSALAYQAALRRKEAAERELAEVYSAAGSLESSRTRPDPVRIASALKRTEVAVGYTVFSPIDQGPGVPIGRGSLSRIAASVLGPEGRVRWVDLGDRKRIEQAVERWRNAVLAPIPRGVDATAAAAPRDEEVAAGTALADLVVAPVRALCPEAKRWYVALDDALHLVPLDALPAGQGVIGDQLEVVVRPILARIPPEPPPSAAPPTLLALGGIEFDRAPLSGAPLDAAAATVAGVSEPASRSGPWERGFAPLPDTVQEVRGIEALFRSTFEKAEGVQRVEGRQASKALLLAQAPGARFLHLATHGYFAPESVASLRDESASSQWVGSSPLSFAEQVKGLSPWILCGLALAGANRPPDATGRIDGVITAEEVSALDLSHCELAVLSACDTNVGLRRAGQGVASLQAALHAAGARSAITSLWKVPDEATKDLMIDFYRRVWVEQKPKLAALWGAKRKLRDARDENGRLQYTLRDWAGWTLTGDPR